MIASIDNSDFSVEHIILVPDRFSLICEKLLLEIMSSKALFNVRVVSLTKFSMELLEKFEVKVKKGDILSNGESLLLTQRAIENVKEEFKTFKKNRISFCYEVSKLISQFKSSRVTPDKLNENARGLVGLKYHDLKLIYQEYQRLLGDKLDANERLNLLNEKFKSKILQNTKIYFAGFEAFTSESYVLLKNLIQSSSEVNLTLAKSLDEGNDYIYEKDIYQKVVSICQELGISAEVISKKSKLSPQKEGVVRGLYSYQKVNVENEGYYNLYSCMNIFEEVEAVAKLIRYKIYRGERYKNIAIAIGGLDKYIVQIENIFDRYQIPFYIDKAVTADKTLLGNLILNFFEVVLYGYSQERLVNLFSNILLGDNKELIEKCQKYNIDNKQKYKKFIEKEFAYADILENLSSAKNAKEFEKVILDLARRVQENFDDTISKLEENGHLKERNINIQVYEILEEALDLISRYSSDISLQEYQKLLSLLLGFKEVSTVPTYVDGVMIGDATESSFAEADTLFVMGGQSLPAVAGDNGILCDEDLGANFSDSVIEPTIKMINRRNRFKLFSLLTLGKEHLIITYQFLNEEGKKNELPSYITSLNNIFCQIELRAGNIFFNRNSDDKEIVLLSSDIAKKEVRKIDKFTLSQEKAREIMFAGDKARVTQIENYFACPYKHFLTYGLRLKEFETAEVDERDVGNICHAGVELYIKQFIKNHYNFNYNLIKFINDNFQSFIDDNLNERLEYMSEKNAFIKIVKRQLLSILKSVIRESKATDFKPKYIEKDFASKFKNGITLIGRADRVDEAEGYLRIIDYKTGKTGNILKELYYGEKLQLFLYQKEAKEEFKLASAGGYYFNSGLEYAKDDEEKVILKGLAPNDSEVILKLDKTLMNEDKSNVLSIAKDSKGGYKGASVSKFDLTTLCNYAYQVTEKAVEEICEGYICPKPCPTACDHCRYHTICCYQGDSRKQNEKLEF